MVNLAVIEAKSQAGLSFGNNFTNKIEEAMGGALDLWTAFREGAFMESGCFFMREECESSKRPVRVKEPHFKVFSEFVGTSYMKRYELFCRKLIIERHYSSASFITSDSINGIKGFCKEFAKYPAFSHFAGYPSSHVRTFVK